MFRPSFTILATADLYFPPKKGKENRRISTILPEKIKRSLAFWAGPHVKIGLGFVLDPNERIMIL